MRCIETSLMCHLFFFSEKINYNMRCIETRKQNLSYKELQDKLQHEMY